MKKSQLKSRDFRAVALTKEEKKAVKGGNNQTDGRSIWEWIEDLING